MAIYSNLSVGTYSATVTDANGCTAATGDIQIMANTKTFIFVSIDGMTDPLGQSQVLPYLVGLAKKGNSIGIVSCEKKENWNLHNSTIKSIVDEAGISWDYCFYKTGKPFISQLQNCWTLKKTVIKMVISISSTSDRNQIILHSGCKNKTKKNISVNLFFT